MEHNLEQTIALLTGFPSVVDRLLRDLPKQWTLHNEGENTWSAFDIIRHLVHVERTDWMPRIRMVLRAGEAETFEPLDRGAHLRGSRDEPLAHALDEFSRLRADNVLELRALNLRPEDLNMRGRHPAFGAVTLSELLAAWAVHDLTHLHQITRVMAYQYRDGVGPWRAYLGVLQCEGHSSS
jgi:hypothetical protein